MRLIHKELVTSLAITEIRADKLLTAQTQRNIPIVWFTTGTTLYEVRLIPTGYDVIADDWTYLDTLQMDEGLVWHVFYRRTS